MTESVTITVLAENRSWRQDLVAEHGLSLWIETDDSRVLFDTGQSGAFFRNAHSLGIPLERPDALVLSHGHYDHTGGLPFLSGELKPARLYLHPDVVIPRYSCQSSEAPRSIGMPDASVAALNRMAGRIVWTDETTQLSDRIGVTGPIARHTSYENTGGPFFLDAAGTVPDRILDDQALWVETRKGIVVVLGCAHAGVVNTLDCLASLLDVKRFHAVLGGMHLAGAGETRLQETVNALNRYGVEILAPCHCTGDEAVGHFGEHFGGQVALLATGSQFHTETS